MFESNRFPRFAELFSGRPHAWAHVSGDGSYPQISGTVKFYQTVYGVVVVAELSGLPSPKGACKSPIFGFHIHTGERCAGNKTDPFALAGTHYNPENCPHPYHKGDLPPLLSANGYAFSAFLTDRFFVEEIIGRTVVVHSSPDDFTT